jgi:hypothetical protein
MMGVGSKRATRIAEQLIDTTAILAGILPQLDDSQWLRTVPPDGRAVGVVVRHLADSHPMVVEVAESVTRGGTIPWTWEGVNEWNAQHAKEHARCAQGETIALLRGAAAGAAERVKRLTDEQLDVITPNPLLDNEITTVAEMLHRILVRHTLWHMGDIQRSLID